MQRGAGAPDRQVTSEIPVVPERRSVSSDPEEVDLVVVGGLVDPVEDVGDVLDRVHAEARAGHDERVSE